MCSPASFDTAYVQRASPTDPIVVTCASCDVERVLAEHLARREVHEPLHGVARRERCFEHVVGADHVHAHRADRALEDGVDSRYARAVDDMGRPGHELLQPLGVEHVTLDELEVRMLGEARPAERVAVQIVDGDDLVRVDEPAGERRADEACAARDDDPLAGQRHAGESRGRYLDRVRAVALAMLVVALALPMGVSATTSAVTSLRITYWANGDMSKEGKAWTLRCEPARGTLAQPAAACRKLAAGGRKLFAPVPRSAVCTEIYGGPDTARIVGVVEGRAVWASFNLTNGCHIERWNRFSPWLLPSS